MEQNKAKALVQQLVKELQNMSNALDAAFEDQHITKSEKITLISQGVGGIIRTVQAVIEADASTRNDAITTLTNAIGNWEVPAKLGK